MDTDLIAGKYILMPQAQTYALGVEALRAEKVARPFTFKENLQVLVDVYSEVYGLFRELSEDPQQYVDRWSRLAVEAVARRKLSDWGFGEETLLPSCTGIAYKAGSTKFKIIPHCAELAGIDKDFSQHFLPINYSCIAGIELDSSDISSDQYGFLLTPDEIINHPAWLAAVEGDKQLLERYTDVVFKTHAQLYGSRTKLMSFSIEKNRSTDELRALSVVSLEDDSSTCGRFCLHTLCSFFRSE